MLPRLSSVGPPVPCRSPPSKPLVSLIVPPPSSCGCVGPAPACLPCLSPPPARPFFLLSLPTIKVRNGRCWSPLGQNLLRKSKTKTGKNPTKSSQHIHVHAPIYQTCSFENSLDFRHLQHRLSIIALTAQIADCR